MPTQKFTIKDSTVKRRGRIGDGGNPTDVMSLRYADLSLPDLLGRQSLRYAEGSMRNTSKCACVVQEVF